MKNVVDSSGWLEYLTKGKNFPFFKDAIQDSENLLVPAICFYEVCKRVLILQGDDAALQAAGFMSYGKEIAVTKEIAINAAKLSHDLKLAMADSIILATAYTYNATLWTQDADFEGIDGVRYIAKG